MGYVSPTVVHFDLDLDKLFSDRNSVRDVIQINQKNVQDEMAKQPALVAYLAQECAYASSKLDAARDHLKATEAAAFAVLSQESSATAASRLIDKEPEVIKAKELYRKANEKNQFAKMLFTAAVQRKDMLIQISSWLRHESVQTV